MVPPEMLEATRGLPIDLSGHRSMRVSPAVVEQADLVVTMTRQHLVELVTEAPSAWTRCFTLGDLLRRAGSVGPRRPGQALDSWLRLVHGGRARAGLLSLDIADDIPDPMGGRLAAFEASRDLLFDATVRLADLLCPAETSPAQQRPAEAPKRRRFRMARSADRSV
jgi:protein-tyrosine-phosphatase